MQDTALLAQAGTDVGDVAVDRLSSPLRIARSELAIAAGLSRDAAPRAA